MIELSSEKYISKSTADFSFTNEILNNVNNIDFLKTVNVENISSVGNQYNHIYQALSAISDILGEKIYEDILNYIDNVGNVDICKTKALQSILDIFGISYSTFNVLKMLPIDLLKLLDILSITPKYLLNSEKIHSEFVKILSSNILVSADGLQNKVEDTLLSIDNPKCLEYIDIEKLDSCISTIYKNHIESAILSTYYDNQILSSRIIDNTYTNYVENNHQISIREKQYDDEILKIKTKYKIPLSFNEILEVDNIDNGLKKLEDFDQQHQEILKIEINRRLDAYNSLKLETRGKFYREKYVQEYITFVEQLYSNLTSDIENLQSYNVDSTYSYLSTITISNLLNKNENEKYVSVNNNMIETIVSQLLQITQQIREIRQNIKNQAQKSFMKGTFLFISYIINEYLRGNIVPILKQYSPNSSILSSYLNDTTTIEQINYIDPTNYFNISTDIDDIYNLKGTNPRFWEEESTTSAIIAPDNTNIFQTLPTTKTQGFSFSKEDIETFYIDVLKNKFDTNSSSSKNHLFKFLNSIFETGADRTFLKDDKISCFVDNNNLSSYKNELYMKYSNNRNAETPYYYHTNTIHPSYQIHPYLSTFIEAYDYSYDIENMPILAEQTMYELLSENLNKYIDEDGYLISIWNNPLNRNSDYLTYYEKVLHLDNNNEDNKLIGYDGLFYPQTVQELISCNNENEYLNFINKWYNGLNISQKFKERIKDQLSCYKQNIRTIAGYGENKSYYDIYQYGKDIYGNIYVLVKKYDGVKSFEQNKNVDEQIKNNTPGELWIRFKNHPIAFPAFNIGKINDDFNYDKFDITTNYDKKSQLDYNQETSNTVFKYMIDIDDNKIKSTQPLIYDFFISNDKTQIELYGQRLIKNIDGSLLYKKIIVVANIQQINNKNIDYQRYVLRFNSIYGKTEYFDINEDEEFKCFYSHKNTYPGFIKISKENNNLKLKCRYFETDKPILPEIIGNLELKDSTISLSDIQLDVYNDLIDVAYFINISDNVIQTYFGNTTNKRYTELSNTIDVFENKLVLHTLKIGNYTLLDKNNIRYFKPFTDMGFLPLIGQNYLDSSLDEDNVINKVSQTNALKLLKEKQILKFQLIGEESLNGIDFIPCMPAIRKYESTHLKAFNDIQPYVQHNDLSILSYSDVHYFENSLKADIGQIYDPYEFKNKLLEINDNSLLNIKINEQFRSIYLTDKYLQFPYLINNSSTIPDNFVTPGNEDQIQLTGINYILAKITTIDTQPLSISYCYREDIGGYKIDFNLPYYNQKLVPNVENILNYQHTFLNLDYPGAAGYLKTYNTNIQYATSLTDFDKEANIENIFYIKNISDDRPKILLSAQNFNEGEYDIEIFGIDNNTAFAILSNGNDFIALGV